MAKTAIGPDELGRRYDASASITDVMNEGQVHLAYWYGREDTTPLREASRRITRKVVDALGLHPGDRVLDAGCGLGLPALDVAEATGAHVTGVTVSQAEVDAATKRAAEARMQERVGYRRADFMALPFPDASFDAVLAMESLVHAPDLGRALREFHRVLRPGGRVGLVEYTLESAGSAAEIEEFFTNLGLSNLLTTQGWIEAFAEAGFALEEYTQCGPRVFGMGPKYIEAARGIRDRVVAQFGDEAYRGLEGGLAGFFEISAGRVGYVVAAFGKPGG
ncbi:class I SAM-dependent methyltransferase [Catenulispora sp. GP43]|uniref:class I SAM-dependent methyltransferase n=1 Tax=Catenulispora sp. GP43 TaxID=3156263 RepID=UPI0035191ED8